LEFRQLEMLLTVVEKKGYVHAGEHLHLSRFASYRLEVTDGGIQITAPGPTGVLRALATIGLDALGFIAAKQAPDRAWVDAATVAIEKQRKFVDASSGYHNAATKPAQPAGEVLIAILPGIQELALAAERIRR